jgi:sugar transferase (PEP-CTERM/EpsH1 system associated)
MLAQGVNPLKILYVCHRFPYPPRRGGKIRPFNMIRHLSSQGHEVTVASLVRSKDEARQGKGIRDYCAAYIMERVSDLKATARMITYLPSLTPSSMAYFYSPRLKRRIQSVLKEARFDLIFVHCSSVAPYVSNVQGVPKILDLGDVDSQKWLTYARFRRLPLAAGYWLEGVKLRRLETLLARKFDYCTCTTRAELETLDAYGPRARTDWFPNGVDTKFFAPTDAPYDPDTICFIGRMDYYPNQLAVAFFARQILPLIRERRPRARFLIVGAQPSRSVRRLGRLAGVTVTGQVPDVRPLVLGSALTVAPLAIARGTQNKILESMAMGVPVVASEQASRGVDAVPGEHLLIASSPQTYRDTVLKVMEDSLLRARLADASRQRMLTHHSWSASLQKLDSLIAECIEVYTSRRN